MKYNHIHSYSKFVVISVFFILFCLNFFSNYFHISQKNKFRRFADQAESFVICRGAMSVQKGIFSYGGLLGRDISIGKDKDVYGYQSTIYLSNIPIKKYKLYMSANGFSGVIFGIFSSVSPFSPQQNLSIWKGICSALSAGILISFLCWIIYFIGLFEAILVGILIFFSPLLSISGGHYYWIFGIFLLPFVLLLWEAKKEQINHVRLFGIVFITVFIKCLITGFELITAASFIVIPIAFLISYWKNIGLKKTVFVIGNAGAASLLAIVFSMFILCCQIAQVKGSFSDGVNHIQQRFLIRSHGDNSLILNEKIQRSYHVPTLQIIGKYCRGKAFSAYWHKDKNVPSFVLPFYAVFLGFLLSAILTLKYFNTRKLKGLLYASLISFIGPLSWFVIFKSHSHMHYHLDYLVWYLPTVFLLFIMIATIAKEVSILMKSKFVLKNNF